MIVYKGYKALYLGLKRWRVIAPDLFIFDIKASGLTEMINNIERWRKIWG